MAAANRLSFSRVAFFLIGSSCLWTAQAAYTAVCYVPGSSNCAIDYQITKDCCTAVANGQKGWHKAQQHFDEPSHNCLSNNLVGGNSVNDGDVAKCCASRGARSNSDGPGNQKYPAGGFYNHIYPKNGPCNWESGIGGRKMLHDTRAA